jgi:hypothetical protein
MHYIVSKYKNAITQQLAYFSLNKLLIVFRRREETIYILSWMNVLELTCTSDWNILASRSHHAIEKEKDEY